MATFEQSLVRLRQNWDKGLTEQLKRTWVPELRDGKWSEAEVEAAVTKCIRDKERVHCPQSFGEFSNYLPPARYAREQGPKLPWWGYDGSWGGDWSNVAPNDIVEYAALMLANLGKRSTATDRHRVQSFMDMAVERGARRNDINERAERIAATAGNEK